MFDFGKGVVPAHQHINGGGWVAYSATVSPSAYIGSEARVYGEAWVSGEARLSGEARVTRTPKVLSGFPFVVTVTDQHIIVGCKNHKTSVWEARGEAMIRAEGYHKEAKSWASIINALAKAHQGDKC